MLKNNDKTQIRQNIHCVRIYLSVLQYDYKVIYRLVNFIEYLSQLPNDIWKKDFILQSSRWIPAVNTIYNYRYSIDDTFSELFLNANEDFYFKYPAQILNFKVHAIKLVKMRCYCRMF